MADEDKSWEEITQVWLRRHKLKNHVSALWGLEETSEGNMLFLLHLLVSHKANTKRKRAKTIANFVKHTFQRTVTVA